MLVSHVADAPDEQGLGKQPEHRDRGLAKGMLVFL